ncbi:MAG: OmpA family protein [Bacteroidota bacterium]
MTKIFIYIVIIFTFLLSSEVLHAQKMLGDFKVYKILDSKDTLLINRKQTDWWFGLTGGFNGNFYFGKLEIPANPAPDAPPIGVGNNHLFDLPSSTGTGSFLGVFGEWSPPESKWGVHLQVNLFDFRTTSSVSSVLPDSVKTRYGIITDFNYVSVSPSARYNLGFWNMNLFGGLDFDLLMSSKAKHKTYFNNTADINHDRILALSPNSLRMGLHVGIAYEFLVADMYNRIKVMFSPYLSLNAGTSIISNYYSSSRNTIFCRAGLSLKFSIDAVQKDTLKFDPDYEEPPNAVVTLQRENGVSFPGFYLFDLLPALRVAYIEKIETGEEVAEASNVVETDVKSNEGIEGYEETTPPPATTNKKYNIQVGTEKSFTFNTSTTTLLSKDAKDYLDAVAEYLKANPGRRVRIVGHSDDQGTFTQQQERSEERARQVVQYLVIKDIGRGKLLDRGDGARNPKALNTTESGRKKNRRVEIVIE